MDERTFFEHEDVKVTNARFLTGGQTFVLQNITSVKTREQASSARGWALLLGIATAIAAWQGGYGWAAFFGVAGALLFYFAKDTYHVILTTSSGEASALKTHQKEYLRQVVEALNQAIVSRG